jgi:hypothetical protein
LLVHEAAHAVSLVPVPAFLGVGAALQPKLSGRRNIMLGGLALGLPRAELEARMDEIVRFAGLGKSIGVAQSSGAVEKTYALVIVVGIIGVAVNLVARALERRTLRWHVSIRKEAR